MRLNQLKEDDRILFNDRSVPLKVAEKKENSAVVEGPQGGKYEIFNEEDSEYPLICKPGKRRYSSYVKNLRKVGEWIENENYWKHPDTGAELRLEKNSAGFWTIEVKNIQLDDLDVPKYGFSDKETVEKEIKKIIRKHPEGK